MNEHVLAEFRRLHAVLHPEPHNWQWRGPHLSQQMFGITEKRAKEYAARHGGVAEPIPGGQDVR